MTRHLFIACLAILAPCWGPVHAAAAQGTEPRMAFAAPAAGIRVQMDVAYGFSGATRLAMDVYTPPAGGAPRGPALIFFNRAVGAERSGAFYANWARAAASSGIVGILPDLRPGSEAADFRLLLSYLEQHAAEHGIGAIAVYAGSGNVSAAFPVVEDPGTTGITAAVMYYGSAAIERFRLDLPVLYVRAGLDRPRVNESIVALAGRAVAQNAPLTLLNHAGGHHGFEMVDDTDATREVIDRTLDFVKASTSASYQASLRASLAEAAAAGFVQTGQFHGAATAYASMVAARPDDARMRLAYGEALLGDKQYASACAEFEKLRDKQLGYRDLGLPAAEACLLKGDAAAAVAWLRTIPAQLLPSSTAADPRFIALRDRPDFQALFTRK